MAWLTGLLADHWLLIAALVICVAALFNPVAVWKFKAWILAAVIAWWGFTGHQAHDALKVAYAEHLQDDAERETRLAQAETAASEAARELEQFKAAQSAAIADAYERGKADAEATGERVVADLRADRIRLREHWRGCETARLSAAATGFGQPDAAADLRAAGAGDLVRIGATCDAHVRGLQAQLRADREQHAGRSGD